jgi:hypothetical protein
VRFPQPRAALDVGEKQRDGAGRKVCHQVVVARRTGYANDTRCGFAPTPSLELTERSRLPVAPGLSPQGETRVAAAQSAR